MKSLKISRSVLAFTLAAFCFFTSCKKEETIVAASDLDTMILGKWQITSVMKDGKENIDNHLLACDKDNIIVLEKDGKGITDFGKNRCGSEKNEPLTWKWLDKNAKKLLIDLGDGELTINDISEKTMKGLSEDVDILTFTKQ